MEHLTEAVRAVGGIRAACLCGWTSNEIWPDSDVGLQGCRVAGRAHLERPEQLQAS